MSDENDDEIDMGGETVSLAQLAGIDLDGIQERRMLVFPVGSYVWEVIAEPEPPKLANIGGKGAVRFNLKCLNVIHVKNPEEAPNGNPADLVGKNYGETFFLTSLESLGWLKAFMVDIGGQGKGALNSLLLGTVGLRFTAPIAMEKNKNDKDIVYFKINRSKIVPEKKMKAA